MNRMIALLVALYVTLVAAMTATVADDQQRPNVIMILADDLGSVDLNCYGATDLETPNLDALAERGIRFTQFYAAAPVCSPSRAAFITGMFPQRAGVPVRGRGLLDDRRGGWRGTVQTPGHGQRPAKALETATVGDRPEQWRPAQA